MSRLLINIDLPDLEAGISFYRDGLGFGLRRLLFDRSVAEMTFDGTQIFLIQQDEGTTAIPGVTVTRSYKAHWTPVHLDIVVADLDRAVATAVTAGARPPTSISDHVWGRLAPMRDPFGHGFCLVTFHDSGYDSVESK